MTRERSASRVDDFGKRPAKRSKGLFRKRNLLLAFLLCVFLGIAVGGPMALSNRDLVVASANRFAGIAPFRIDLESTSVGWVSPLRIRGIRLIDEAGVELIKVAELDSEIGLLRLARNYNSLGTVTIRGALMQIDVQPGTTSVEEALKPLLGRPAVDPSPADGSTSLSASPFPTGRIRLENAMIMARDSVDSSTWRLTISEADIPLPTADQKLPPVNLVGGIQQLTASPGRSVGSEGKFTIRTSPIEGAASNGTSIPPMQMTIATNGLPLEWYSLVHRRFPSIPIDQLRGMATVQADIAMLTPSDIQAKIATAQIDQLHLIAPQWVGEKGAALKQIRLSGKVNMIGDRLTAEEAILESDIGALGVAASLPTAFNPPTTMQPWIENAQWNIQGNVDIAKLLGVAPGMLPMQDETELVAGKATLSSVQTILEGGRPKGEHRVQLGDLVANVAGKPMKWENALKASVMIESNEVGQARIGAECQAEFCELNAHGDLHAGQLKSNVDLDKLHQRLSKWFALPLQQLSGNANLEVNWKQESGNRIAAQGVLATTPMRIVLPQGRLNEPAWKGKFHAIGTLDRGSLLQIDRGSVSLDSESESLRAELQEPLTCVQSAPGAAPLPPAAMSLALTGDMAAWQRRGQLLAGIDLGLSIDGRCELNAQGAIDLHHVEVTAASFNAQPFGVNSPSFRLREPRVEGSFAGRIDSNDIARLQVEKFLVQAESFAITAKDSATPDGSGREGKAAFCIEPKRLLTSIAMSDGSTAAPNNLSVEGNITGNASWLIVPTSDIRWQLGVDAKDVRVSQMAKNQPQGPPGQLVSTAPNNGSMDTLWEEPIAKASIAGIYNLKSGKIELPETTLQTIWMAYGGTTSIHPTHDRTQVIARGQVTYDASAVAEKLKPWTGNYLAVAGQRTEPVEVTWTSSPSGNWADSLQAKTQLGWDSANVIGIDIGRSDVPLAIENGRFRSKTTIPVSQGALRWDLDGDVGGNPIVIKQAPEVVLDNVAITPQMCQGWLKYVAPLLADVTSVQGQLSLQVDRAEIVPTDSLRQTIEGELMVKGATVGPGPLADQLLGIVQQVRALRKGAAGQTAGTTTSSWLQMPEQRIQFAMNQGRVAHRNLQIQAGDIAINTEGSVGIDGQLELIANIPILKDWVDGTPALASLAGQQLRVPIQGNLQRPQVDMQAFTSIGRQVAESAVQGVIQKQLDRGFNKLLGPLEKQLAPLQQGIQQNLPQLPQLPGGFQIPGFGGGTPAPQPPPPPPPQ